MLERLFNPLLIHYWSTSHALWITKPLCRKERHDDDSPRLLCFNHTRLLLCLWGGSTNSIEIWDVGFEHQLQVGSGVHVEVTEKEIGTGSYYWGKSPTKGSLFNKWVNINMSLLSVKSWEKKVTRKLKENIPNLVYYLILGLSSPDYGILKERGWACYVNT